MAVPSQGHKLQSSAMNASFRDENTWGEQGASGWEQRVAASWRTRVYGLRLVGCSRLKVVSSSRAGDVPLTLPGWVLAQGAGGGAAWAESGPSRRLPPRDSPERQESEVRCCARASPSHSAPQRCPGKTGPHSCWSLFQRSYQRRQWTMTPLFLFTELLITLARAQPDFTAREGRLPASVSPSVAIFV